MMRKRRFAYGAWLLFVILLYFFENNTGTRTISVSYTHLDVYKRQVFATVLEHAGVYKCTPEGREAFLRFVQSV